MTNLFFKQSPWSHLVAAGAFALLFTACGDEITEVTEVVGMQVVEAGDALPKCSADNEGAMVYSVDSAAAYTCIGRKWTSMKGKDGADGKDGKDGADGKNGKDGKNGTNGEDGAKGAPGVKGDSGATGNNGLSAYEIAKAGGYTGTEEEWITSLKGDTGVAGTSCSAVEVSDGVEITCTDGNSVKLRNGADGKDVNGSEFGWMVDSRDRQFYRIVTIGDQTWMAENLNYKTKNSWCGGGLEKTEGDCSKYGRLYTWAAAIDSVKLYKDKALYCGYGKTCSLPDTVYGICPPGWHLPDTTDWNKLFTAVGGKSTAGKELKSRTGWISDDWVSDGKGTDAYGFSALPAGYGTYYAYFYDEGRFANFWSATEYNSRCAYHLNLNFSNGNADLDRYDEDYAFSVRCLKD